MNASHDPGPHNRDASSEGLRGVGHKTRQPLAVNGSSPPERIILVIGKLVRDVIGKTGVTASERGLADLFVRGVEVVGDLRI